MRTNLFRNIFYSFCWLFLVFTISCQKEKGTDLRKPPGTGPDPNTETNFTNPILSSGPDPWVIKQGEYYYYTHTLGNRIGLAKTKAVSRLSQSPLNTVWTPPAGTSYSTNLWAPELHFINGKWYIYFAADDTRDINHRLYVLENTAADPTTGEWVFKGKIADTSDKWAIDGTVLEYNGQLYFIWSGWRGENDPGIQQLYIARMTNPWTLEGTRAMLSEPTYAWEKNGLVNEGPQILKNSSGRVFLVYSASGCWTDDYALGMLTLKEGGNPLIPGDWTKSPNPVFKTKPASNAFGPGHNSFFKSPDGKEDWLIYHANSVAKQGCGDTRNPRIQPFTWNADGTPNLGEPVSTGSPIPRPSGEVQ
ncbi:glycoside hydrolase family 43 protein [Adhaeribacter aerolatus]|uniref:glycoside hydrolase family 43 protein n=1 Tax=Adhaeribacter aerolatus TaxID=670289 RepID=UPI0011BF5252|nr:glycoside hydrolase family 43 protein [Adhaeribacter aerolatus]